MYRYTYKILKIDLSKGSSEDYIVPDEIARDYIGGRGLGVKLLWDNQEKGKDPMDEEGMLLFLTGPLTGMIPGGAHICVVAKSPETKMTLIHALTGGQFGAELRFSGYDGLWIEGKAPKPTVIYVNDGKLTLLDGSKYRGLDAFETPRKIKEDLNDPLTRILCIGPAGENKVKFASIQQEYFRAAARGGSGTLMGNKNIKAIAVRGTGALEAVETERFLEARKIQYDKFLHETRTTRRGYNFGRYGSITGQLSASDTNELDVRNYKEVHWDEVDRVSGIMFDRRLKVKSRSCFNCPIACMHVGKIRSGEWKGTIVCPDFDSSGTIGPGLMLQNIEENSYLSRLGDQYGLDDASMGNVLGFVTECYEKGIITKEQLGGLEPKFGDAKTLEKMIFMIINREGFGDVMAEGVKHIASVVGEGSEFFAMHAKGMEYAGYSPKFHHDRGLQYAVGDRGGCHHFGMTISEQNMRAIIDSFGSCGWNSLFYSPDIYLNLLSAITGFDYKSEDWTATGERIILLSRSYNIREGMVPLRDDILPGRVHYEPVEWGPKAGMTYPKEKFDADRETWYLERGCSTEGIPTSEKLKSLKLEYCIDEMLNHTTI